MPTIDSLLNQIWQVHQAGHPVRAEAAYRQLLHTAPQHPATHVYLGIALFDQHRYAEAEAAYREGLRLQPAFPVAWNNLGNALRMQDQIEQADRCFETALQQQPGYLSALKNRGTLWIWAGEIERGLQWYQQALQVAPEEPELHRNLGVIYLLQGRFAEGWREYRWRWRMPGLSRPPAADAAAAWQGQDLRGRTILLYPEQGLGDAIHFVRMAQSVKTLGAHTVLVSPPRMIPLLASAAGVDKIVPEGLDPGVFDYHASLIEVADQLQVGDAVPIPADVPYLSVPENLRGYWANRLANLPGRKVGICWQGNRHHHADHYRSVSVQQFAPVAACRDVTLVSLQHGFGSEQAAEVSLGASIVRPAESIDQTSGAFLDTAAIMHSLDLVITTDTSTAHLAGALGVPVWVALAKVPDWRWRLDGDRSPWYPNMRLFRQTEVGRWDDVFASMAERLNVPPSAS